MSLKMTVALGMSPGKLIFRVAVSPALTPDTDPFNIRGDALLPGNEAVSSKVPTTFDSIECDCQMTDLVKPGLSCTYCIADHSN